MQMTIDEIHKSKVLYIIRDEMMDDIMSSIDIVNERLQAPIKISKYGDIIEARSFVNGYEGYIPIIRLETLLCQSRSELFYPVVRIRDIQHNKTHEISLKEVSLREFILLQKETLNKFFNRRRKATQMKDLLMQNTQTERMQIFDIVTSIVENLSQMYEFGGCLRTNHHSLL